LGGDFEQKMAKMEVKGNQRLYSTLINDIFDAEKVVYVSTIE
jgi:hypothetical protein